MFCSFERIVSVSFDENSSYPFSNLHSLLYEWMYNTCEKKSFTIFRWRGTRSRNSVRRKRKRWFFRGCADSAAVSRRVTTSERILPIGLTWATVSLVAAVVPWRKLCLSSSRNPSRGSVSVATTSLLMQAPLTAPPKSRLPSLSKNALEPLLANEERSRRPFTVLTESFAYTNRRVSTRLRFPFHESVQKRVEIRLEKFQIFLL